MRYKFKPVPKIGDKKTKTFFAWWPISDNDAIYWLETVTVDYEYCEIEQYSTHLYGKVMIKKYGWVINSVRNSTEFDVYEYMD